MRPCTALAALTMLANLAACGGAPALDAGPERDAGSDAGAVARCERSSDCSASMPCAVVSCEPGNPEADARGCIVGSRCGAGEVCEMDRCVPACEDPDADGDHDASPDCGGYDCDDTDPSRHSDAQELCDPAGVDEDCNPETISNLEPGDEDGDADEDGLIDYRCFNTRADGTENHGTDCDQSIAGTGLGTLAHCSACEDRCQFACLADGCDEAVDVSVGDEFSCALVESGAVYCWGDNTMGQLGQESGEWSPIPLLVSGPGLPAFVEIDSTAQITQGVTADGSVWAWGRVFGGRMPRPQQLLLPFDVTAIASGPSHQCSIISDGRVHCAGSNSDGQIGIDSTDTGSRSGYAVGIASAVAIAVGSIHSCAVTSAREVFCWGDNAYGQIGNGARPADALAPVQVAGIDDAVGVAAGWSHTCVARASGVVSCWGSNALGALGVDPPADGSGETCSGRPCSSVPVSSPGVSGIEIVSAFSDNTCAIDAGGTARCWGRGDVPGLGDGASSHADCPSPLGSIDCSFAPVTVPVDPRVTSVRGYMALLRGHACSISNGDVYCWGTNARGELGDGSTAARSLPTLVVSSAP